MFAKLLILFIGLPLVELAILVRLGEWMGFWPTITLVVVTGFIGAALAKQQGFRTWARIQSEMAAGRMPTAELLDGLLILIGGVVLLTPGLLTDLFGFSLLVPPVRAAVKAFVQRRFVSQLQNKQGRIYVDGNKIE